MRPINPIRSLLIFVLVVFLGGALIAPWLCWFVHFIAPDSELAHSPFHRYVNRSLIILALAGMWPLLRSLGATSFKEIGFTDARWEAKNFCLGLALGFFSLALAAVIIVASHGRKLETDAGAGQIVGKLAGAAMTALGVAVIEELLFRGGIFGALRRIWNWKTAVLASSLIYAIVHFLQKADLDEPVKWNSGLKILLLMLGGFGDLKLLIPCFFNLTLAGIILALGYQRTGKLYFSIGLHAGWIFWLKSYGVFTQAISNSNAWFWGSQKLIDGWLAMIILIIALVIFFKLPLRRKDAL